ASPARWRRDDPVRKLHLSRGAGGAWVGADQQVLGRLSRPALLRRAAIYRRGRKYRTRPRLRAVSRRARQRPAAFRLADEPGVLFRLPQSRRHGAGDGPFAWRSPDAWG